MFDSILYATETETTITVQNLLITLLCAIGLGFVNSIVYMKAGRQKTPSQSFAITLIVLPAVITVIILLVGNNVARAFSLAGAFSIIRFRSTPGDPKDITYVLFSMAIGLACGMGFVAYAVVAAIILCGIMAVLELTGFGQNKTSSKIMKITIHENLDYQTAFDGVMSKYIASYALTKIKTTELGSLYELIYDIHFKKDVNEKEFIDEVRCINGNLNISMFMNVSKAEPESY